MGDAGRACRGADGAEPLDVFWAEGADVGEAVLEGGVELEFAPSSCGFAADPCEFLACSGDSWCVELECVGADCDGAEEESVSCEPCVEVSRAVCECCEEVVAGGEADAGADGRDVVQVVPCSFEFEQDRSHPGEFGCRVQAEAFLAGVCVGEAVCDGAGGAGAADEAGAVGQRGALGGAL